MTQPAPKREIPFQLDSDDDEQDAPRQLPPSNPLLGLVRGAVSNRPLMTGRALKRVAWLIYKPRYLMLFEDPPRLTYYEPDTNLKKVGKWVVIIVTHRRLL